MRKTIALIVISAIVFAIALYMVIPKYDIYVDGESGVHIYRFNKITGIFDTLQVNGNDWSSGLVGYVDAKGIKHAGTWKEK
ncbi:MAG: hypothetical protein ABIG46_01915 [Candidatus Omnitrophota bacterium]